MVVYRYTLSQNRGLWGSYCLDIRLLSEQVALASVAIEIMLLELRDRSEI